jgi:hypothetical protein
MRFLLDAHVSDQVSEYLAERGHEVFLVRDRLLPGSADILIVADAHALGAVVVTWNRKHFRPLISREAGRARSEFPNAGLLSFTRCRMDDAVRLLDRYIENIEFEHERRQRMDDARVIIEISHNGMMMF